MSKRRKKVKKSPLRSALSWTIYILIILTVAIALVQFLSQRTEVSGDSMQPTLDAGDYLIVDKITYAFSEPQRFDVIVFPSQYQEDTFYIKRIIGMPGETVQITNGMVYINGEALLENDSRETIHESGLASVPVTLEEGEYFVLGDNRNNSTDSRSPGIGNVQDSNIIGKAWLRIWPLEKFGLVR